MALSMPLRLIIEDDEGATTIVPLGKEAITIGRQQGNTIQLTEKNVSRTHARLFPESEAWMIEDLNSYNGIKVNDKSVDGRTLLREGDIVQIGDYHLAITEDVDKRTLNYDRPGQAANDGDAMLASSSADLPRVAPEEAHALTSGPQPITPPPAAMMLDSGPVPASGYAQSYDEPRKKNGGLLILLGVLVLGAGAIGAYLITRDSTGDTKDAVASAGKSADTPPAPAPAKADTPPAVPTPPAPAADDAAAAAADADAEPAGDDIAISDDPPPVEPTPTPPVEPTPAPTPPPDNPVATEPAQPPPPAPTPVKKKKRPPKPAPPPVNNEPVDTGPSADELYAQAKKLMFSSPSKAYALAKQSYAKKPSQKAAQLMGTSACKMKDPKRARFAYTKLRGSAKDDLKRACDGHGIAL